MVGPPQIFHYTSLVRESINQGDIHEKLSGAVRDPRRCTTALRLPAHVTARMLPLTSLNPCNTVAEHTGTGRPSVLRTTPAAHRLEWGGPLSYGKSHAWCPLSPRGQVLPSPPQWWPVPSRPSEGGCCRIALKVTYQNRKRPGEVHNPS
jgi:hypothetical protein